jgi:hypothetical protein
VIPSADHRIRYPRPRLIISGALRRYEAGPAVIIFFITKDADAQESFAAWTLLLLAGGRIFSTLQAEDIGPAATAYLLNCPVHPICVLQRLARARYDQSLRNAGVDEGKQSIQPSCNPVPIYPFHLIAVHLNCILHS